MPSVPESNMQHELTLNSGELTHPNSGTLLVNSGIREFGRIDFEFGRIRETNPQAWLRRAPKCAPRLSLDAQPERAAHDKPCVGRRTTITGARVSLRDQPHAAGRSTRCTTHPRKDHTMSKREMPPQRHAPNCDWWTDQYPWECTCGAIRTAARASETDKEQAQP